MIGSRCGSNAFDWFQTGAICVGALSWEQIFAKRAERRNYDRLDYFWGTWVFSRHRGTESKDRKASKDLVLPLRVWENLISAGSDLMTLRWSLLVRLIRNSATNRFIIGQMLQWELPGSMIVLNDWSPCKRKFQIQSKNPFEDVTKYRSHSLICQQVVLITISSSCKVFQGLEHIDKHKQLMLWCCIVRRLLFLWRSNFVQIHKYHHLRLGYLGLCSCVNIMDPIPATVFPW